MMLADSSYPLGSALLTMTVFFAWFLWIWLLVLVYMDLFRRDDIGGWGKTGWVLFTVVLPFIGVFVYLIVEGRAMADRQDERVMRQQRTFDDRVRSMSGGTRRSGDAEAAKARQLLDSGAVTQQEYEVMRQKALLR